MIQMLEERGSDIVAGWRQDRKDPFFSRRLPSMIANAIISFSTGVKLHDYGCSLKVFRAEVVKPLKLYGEMHRFLPAIASEMGVTIVEKVVNHRPRRHGTLEVRHLAHDSRHPRSAHGQVPDQLLDAAAAHLRSARDGDGQSGRGRVRLARVGEVRSATRASRTARCCCSASC